MIDKKLSVILPCYNEEKNISESYQRLTGILRGIIADYELIFVDDKSTDNTWTTIQQLAENDSHVIGLSFSRNFGSSQYGFTAGMDHATGDGIVLMDADLQDPPELIEEFVKKWQEGYEVIYGVRKKRKGSLFLRVAYKIFYVLFDKTAFIKIPRDAGDFSLIDKKVAQIINAMPERDRYLRGLRAWAGFKSIGVEYVRDLRHSGETSNTLVSNIKWAKKAVFSFSYAPVEFIFYLALAVLVFSVGAIFFYFISFFISGPPEGFTTLLLFVLFLGSVQLLSLSIIAEYIGRIFEEIKERPKYIVEKVIHSGKNLQKKI